METKNKEAITVQTVVKAPVQKVWACWTDPKHITQWCSASDDWHAPSAENDARTNGKFKTRMEAKDGSMGFDFEGVYSNVIENKRIEYDMADGRQVKIEFTPHGNETRVMESFDPESQNSEDMQRQGWQAILNNFKNYTESTL